MDAQHVVPSAHNLVKNASFTTTRSLPWGASFTQPAAGKAAIENGLYCVELTNTGANPWDAQMRHREMTIQQGHTYAVRFKVAATVPTQVTAKIGMSGPPYKSYWQTVIAIGQEPKLVDATFAATQPDDPTAEFAFHLGGRHAAAAVPFSVCIDDVVLEDPAFDPKPDPAPLALPNVLVNQVGYLPGLAKIAIVKTDSPTPILWSLVDSSHRIVATGKTEVHGADPASGDLVHAAVFSTFRQPGKGYALETDAGTSHPFAIEPDVYRKLKYDALAYFYQTRAGTPIEMPYAVDPRWTHPAGHPGDKNVACAPDAGCNYSLDVSGGWYDAGDHGKYVVNGGITVWTLLNLYERSQAFGDKAVDFGDGKMNIPENHNGVPDLLDEARWELEFLMRMQVPEGKPLAGMAHHKIHDQDWTALGTSPDKDTVPRFLRPVSTAATLNLAAVTAQCARIWKPVDSTFSRRCLQASVRAWNAATAHPGMLITSADQKGGGAYDDNHVDDEFYWAAAELYVTTSEDAYKRFIDASAYRATVPATMDDNQTTSQMWGETEALGTISLAVVPNGWPARDRDAARTAIIKAADSFLAVDKVSGYRVPFRPGKGGLHWGSNALPLNNGIELGLAFDLTKDPKYLDGAVDILSYILGRNPLDQSYVTGYGARPLQNPHHRHWAHQANPNFPFAPPGIVSGGPNSDLQDPYVRAAGLQGCAPMKCFYDHIEAYSVNEEAINWNAALFWLAAVLDEHGSVRSSAAP